MDTLCFPVKRADHFMYPAAMFRTKERPTHGGDDMTPVVAGRSEPAVAFDSGVVVIADLTAEPGDTSGIDVMIRSDQTGILGWYGHFSWGAVKRGQRVRKGQFIGYTGSTGNSSGCHLHFEMHYPYINVEIDPWPWIWDAPDVTGSQMGLAPTREKALELYPDYQKPGNSEKTQAEKEEEELMSAIDDIQGLLDAQTELLSSRIQRENRPEVYYIETDEQGRKYTLDDSPAAALIHPASGFIMPLDPADKEGRGQVDSLKRNYRIISNDSRPEGFHERVFYNTIKDVARGAGLLDRVNDEAEQVAWAKSLF